MGAHPALEEFRFERLEPITAGIQLGGRQIEGLPLFDAPGLPGGGITGKLGPLGSRSPIGFLITNSPSPDPEYDAIRRNSGHEALVAVTVGAAPGLQARNAGSFDEPFGVPVLQVASEHEGLLRSEAEANAEATLTLDVRRVPGRSSNIMVRVAGSQSGLPPLVVSTPRTGWWNCSGERGGGIACWLELVHSALAEPYARDAIFVAFSGHELDHLGLKAFLEQRPDIPTLSHAWIHFGANVGASEGAAVRVAASHANDLASARTALDAQNVGPLLSPGAGTVIGGESSVVAGMGARVVALLGGNLLFHLQSDRWPAANDVPQVVRQAVAFDRLARELAAVSDGQR